MTRAHDTCPQWISLVELLRRRAGEEPDKRLFAFLPDGEDDDGAITLTRGELDGRARALAARLQALGLTGQRALLLYPPGLGFVEAFCGCLYAGVIAVPAYPPRTNRPMTRLQSVVGDAQPSVVLTCASQSKDALRWETGVPELRGVRRLITDGEGEEIDKLARRWNDPGARPDTLAFLQYTSGSTAAPKGAMITHGNLLHNSALIHECFGSGPEGRGVFWLPLFHDMGLIGGVIQTIYCGGSSTLFSPVHFLHRPIRWLQAISRTRATISGGPNFAYELCVEKTTPEERAGLDLSCWRVAFNGAETVRPETLDRFARAFGPAGFCREAFLPCYGLAEATLLVSGGPSGSPPVVLSFDAEALWRGEVAESSQTGQSKCLASSGEVAAGHRVVIVDPLTQSQCAEDRIGEIWVSGPSVAEGYWGRTAETQETLRANLNEGGGGPFLRTGDLGFLKDGILFVTGRLKDLIILRGRNIYPQDVEWIAERCHPALCAGGAAAFAIEVEGEEHLAIAQEIKRHSARVVTEEVIAAIRQAIADQFDIEVYAIRLIQPLSLPKTSSGKVQRHACRKAFLAGSLEVVAEWTRQDAAGPSQASKSSDSTERSTVGTPVGPPTVDAIVAWLTERISGPLGIRPDEVDIRKPLASYGLGSLQAVRLASELEQWLGRKLPPTLAYDYPTIDALANVLSGVSCSQVDGGKVQPVRGDDREPIAIIGIGCRFPGADGPVEFWRLLRGGVEAIGQIPASRWDDEALSGLDIPRRGGFLEQVDQFDADFFGISPREAVFVDPQHRLLLEVTWEAIEDGGQVPERLAGSPVGVFVGISTNDYAQLQAMRGGPSDGYRITGSAASIAANRISHHFDFRGPSLSIDTACSSSMVAVHLACKSLWDGECELAVAGGANLILVPEVFASFAKAGFLSPDGRCRAFDAQADGYVRGEGAGMVALKPLSRAIADGDPIYAVIRGGAVNQDGRTNGLTAPSRLAQEAVLRGAYWQAGVSPGQIDYVEAHGTGTLLGDPIELAALGAVLSEGRDLDRRCALGSVKTNIGHLEAAAGVAGLIKTALALHHRVIPPSLHFSQPNPHIAFDELPVRVQCKLDVWPDCGRPSLAGVSSFGFGGTNAHLVLQEAPAVSIDHSVTNGGEVLDDVVVPLSARSPAALWDLALAIRAELSDPSRDLDLVDLAHTAGARRGHHDYRLALVVSSRDEVVEALDAYRRGEPHLSSITGRRLSGRRPRTVFVFSGEGGLWQGAGRALFDREPSFRGAIERCDSILSRQLGWSPAAELRASRSSSRIGDPAVDQAVQFALQVALVALWESWGIVPERSVGDGIGEVTAAVVAGSLSLEDAASIIARGQADAASPARWIPSMPRFPEAIAGLAQEGFQVFLEVGPHPILTSAVKESLGPRGATALVLPSLRRGDAGLGSLRWSAACLYAAGFDLEWTRVSPPGRFVRLPGYP
ncbi:MAG TPA: beta-ketoacyl synthase N-terminal-like domain-containing protein, partial [Isosphaeraceae bacterium]|nr:beta-ketoacyl synthase N-terminal-like domain-containing protein [Isosphaeraceae bacterium]